MVTGMGKQNRERRAAKHRVQRRRHPAAGDSADLGSAGPDTGSPTDRERIADLWQFAAMAARRGAPTDTREAGRALARLGPVAVAEGAERLALDQVDAAWKHGWQPAELRRHVQRSATAPAARLALAVIAADHAERPAASLDPRWIAQLDALALPRVSRHGWLRASAAHSRTDWSAMIATTIDLVQSLSAIGPIPVVLPPPGHPDNGRIDLTSPVDDPILGRVRALLAQAESTTFEAEAEAFTAKAQELMTRHAIDDALLDARTHRDDEPVTLRLPIDDPYADAKSLLVHVVADRSRCRAVFDRQHGLSSIVGLARDVAATDLLFTSLLVQGSTAMHAAAANAPAGAHTRTRGFRASFWLAYTTRVGERLAEINERLVRAADLVAEGALLPVLARRSARVDAAVDEMFGALGASRVRGGHDRAGWASGRAAADAARLTGAAIGAGDG